MFKNHPKTGCATAVSLHPKSQHIIKSLVNKTTDFERSMLYNQPLNSFREASKPQLSTRPENSDGSNDLPFFLLTNLHLLSGLS
jgi:hypothetical protein